MERLIFSTHQLSNVLLCLLIALSVEPLQQTESSFTPSRNLHLFLLFTVSYLTASALGTSLLVFAFSHKDAFILLPSLPVFSSSLSVSPSLSVITQWKQFRPISHLSCNPYSVCAILVIVLFPSEIKIMTSSMNMCFQKQSMALSQSLLKSCGLFQ